jgi:tRNA A-37 threonylcarbamoyl transferase component Bud32
MFQYFEKNNEITTYIEMEKLHKLGHYYIENLLNKLEDPRTTYFQKLSSRYKIFYFYVKVLKNYDILHQHNVAHLDGRLDNFMLSKEDNIYFIDFGLSVILNKDMNSFIVEQAKDSIDKYIQKKNLNDDLKKNHDDLKKKLLRCFLRIYDIWYFYTDFIRVIDRVIEDHKEYRNKIKKRIDRILKDTGCEDCKDAIMEIIKITLKTKSKRSKDKRYYHRLFKYYYDLEK